jgi:DNA-binding FrmR family transcriptional regulator
MDTLPGYIEVYSGRVFYIQGADMEVTTQKRLVSRVKRIGGQVTGIERMLTDKRYCVDILNQISAVRSALDALGVELLTRHLETCVLGHGSSSEHEAAKPMTQEELLAEVKTALSRFLK